MTGFAMLTDEYGNVIAVKRTTVTAVTKSEFPKCETAVWVGPGPNDCFNVVESIKQVLIEIEQG